MIYCLVINGLIISIFETKISYQFATIVVADRLRAFNVKTVQKLVSHPIEHTVCKAFLPHKLLCI